MSADVRPLGSLRVVDLSTWIGGAYAARLLADGGAGVTRIEPEGGHPLRRWSASGAVPAGEQGPLFRHLAADQTTIGVEGLDEALADADACLWSPGGHLEPATIAAAHPHLTVVAITPFGLETPWSDRPATDFTLQAWSGGIVGLGRGAGDQPPVHVGGQVGEWLAGAYAAFALLATRRMVDGRGVVDLSMLEVQAMCLTYHPVTYHDRFGRPMRKRRGLTIPGVAAASDGLVGLGVGTGQQWLDFASMTGHPEWADDRMLFTDRGALAPDIDAWVGAHTVDEVLDTASAFRLPNAPIVDGANGPAIEHFRARDTFRTDADGVVHPRPPLRITAKPVPAESRRGAQAGPLPFSGLRVLDMTAFWAGPSASHLLAMLGAEVIHLESARRPDGARLVGGAQRDEEQYWEKGPIFAALNTNKRSLTVDLGDEAGIDVVRRVVATCDIVIENYTPRVMEQLGLSEAVLREVREDLIVVRMPGFGLDGPWRDNAAFAFVIEDAAGLTWLTGHPDRLPVEPNGVGDPNAGLHAAYGVLLALAHRDATGGGAHVEAAMVDAALSISAEQFVEYSATGSLLTRDGNRGPVAAPQNLYDCSDPDEYGHEPSRVAIAVATDEQWAILVDVLGRPVWAIDPAFVHAAGRRAAHDAIDAHLQEWCRARPAAEVVDRLWTAGVPVGLVQQPHRQPELAPLGTRGFFEELDHPVMGPARYSTVPFRAPGLPARIHHRPAPLLGADTEPLLGEVGFTDEEITALRAAGVISDTPDALG